MGLSSSDPEVVRKNLEALGHLGTAQAAASIEARLRRGLPPPLIEVAIASLVELRKPSAEAVLVELTLHKRAQVRRQAIAALGALRLQSAHPTLLRALDDPSAEVRSAAVASLVQLGGSRSIPALLRADEHGVSGALAAVGAIAGPADAKLVLQRAAQSDAVVTKPALQALLDRPNFPGNAKLQLIEDLAKLEVTGVRAFLLERFSALPPGSQPEMRRALAMALKRIDAGAQATSRDARPAETKPAAVPGPAIKAPALATTASGPHAGTARASAEAAR